MTACEGRKILCFKKPTAVYNLYQRTDRSLRLLLPKFKKENYKSRSFIYNSSKILNLLLAKNINYSLCSTDTFKINVKRYLMARQNIFVNKDPNWLPNNYSIFSDIRT